MGETRTVLVTRAVPQVVAEELSEHCDADIWDSDEVIPRGELFKRIEGCAGAITMLTDAVDAELLDAAGPALRIIANHAVGYDNIDVEECTRRRVMVSNTPDVLTETTADMAWALMMAAARRVTEGDRFIRSNVPWIWAPEMMLGVDVYGKVLGIVGLGRIGQAVARRAVGFGMRTVYFARQRVARDIERQLSAEFRPFDELLAEADFIRIHADLNPETRHLFGPEVFGRMKATAVLVNTSRGPVVDEAALVEALRSQTILAAALDVYENEPEVHPGLLELDNAVLVPHLGSATVETRTAMGLLAVDNVVCALEGRRPPTLVNPEVSERVAER